jgi:hypothetical protein
MRRAVQRRHHVASTVSPNMATIHVAIRRRSVLKGNERNRSNLGKFIQLFIMHYNRYDIN